MPSDRWPPGGPESYWRRRVFAFGGVLAILGLVAWACSAATAGLRTPEPAATNSAATPRAAADGVPTSAPTVTVTARAPRKTHKAVRAHRPHGLCAAGDVVISLAASQPLYEQPAEPRFTIYAVNTGERTCAFDVGSRSLRLEIKSGPVHSWNPADCARGSGSHMVHLSRGVPFVRRVSWNRERSEPGCTLPRTVALPGTYTATVTSRAGPSQTEVFLLR